VTTNDDIHRTINHYPQDALADSADLDVITTSDASTLDEVFRERVRRSSDKIAFSQFDRARQQWVGLTWAELASEVERWQVAFRDSGLEKGDRVAICYRNSIEWIVFDQAALRLGLVVVPLYLADRPDNLAYVLSDSAAKLVMFESSKPWSAVLATGLSVSCVETVLVFTEESDATTLVSSWLPSQGQHLERGVAEADDIASIVYTSGTTGQSKGVMLSHKNMLANAYGGLRSVALKPSDSLLSFLPLSHTLERTAGYYAALLAGSSVTFNRSIAELANDLKAVKPSVMVAVPRIFERVHNQIYASLRGMSPIKRALFKAAIRAGWSRFRHVQGVSPWHPRILLAATLDKLVAKAVRERLGGNLKYVIVGGAPLSEDIAKTFISLGIPLLQGYGLTESSPVVSVNTVDANRPDSIGLPLRGVQVKVAEDDELWVKGENVMLGYWGNEQATQRCIVEDDEGRWLRTGDCAAIDEQGFIRIIGRIKDILVLDNGEKVPPSAIESAILCNPLFEQVMLVGEGRPFLGALVVLNTDEFANLCTRQGWEIDDYPEKDLNNYLLRKMTEQMKRFPGYARVRRVHVCDSEWNAEEGLLTATLKIKRPAVAQKYEVQIDSFYVGWSSPKV
jgi:long-chain acyl-CoA synthetase